MRAIGRRGGAGGGRRPRIGVGVVLALGAAVTGCGHEPARTAAAVAVVVAHHADELAPSLGAAQRAALRTLAEDPHDDAAVVHVVAAGRPGVETVDLEPRRPNGAVERGPRIGVLVDQRLDALQAAIDRAAREGTDVDLLRALDQAARTGAGTIVVLSAGVTTVDPLDLRIAGWDRDPQQLAAELHAAGRLPDLTGRDVVFGGLGRTAGAQQPLGVREQDVLRRIWLELCAAGGGRCRIDDAVRRADPPVSVLSPPVVAVPSVATTRGTDGTETVEVPAPLLFGPDDCTVPDRVAAAAVLAPVAVRLRAGGVTVAISGRTAPVGPGDGVALATCRAHAAADLLRSLGVPAGAVTAVRGDGRLLDPPDAGLDGHGRPDPARLGALRRVIFTLTPEEVS